jgi:hypothetical protein
MRGVHDVGGLAAGRITAAEHDYAAWEKRVDALNVLLTAPSRRLLSTDERRRHIEALGEPRYGAMRYYERWMHSICAALVERGVLSVDELARKMAEVAARGSAR